MTAFTIEVKDEEVRAKLKALAERSINMRAVLQTIGEGIIERTKHRFDTSTDPAGHPWHKHKDATLAMLSKRLSGAKSNIKKNGSLNAKGQRAYANKKLLVDTGFLRQQIVQSATSNALTVSATAKYAAVHQFGGKAGRGKKVTIPARPFLPIYKNGTLYPKERTEILNAINAYLMDGL